MTAFEYLCNTETSTARIKRIIIETAASNAQVMNRAAREILCKYVSHLDRIPDLRWAANHIDNYRDALQLLDAACGWYAIHICPTTLTGM